MLAATRKNAADEMSAGTSMRQPVSGWPPAMVTTGPSRPTVDAESSQHPLGVVARGRGLGDAGGADGVEAGEDQRRLDLRARDAHPDVGGTAARPPDARAAADGRPRCRCARPSTPAARPPGASAAGSGWRRRSAGTRRTALPAVRSAAASRCPNCRSRAPQPVPEAHAARRRAPSPRRPRAFDARRPWRGTRSSSPGRRRLRGSRRSGSVRRRARRA